MFQKSFKGIIKSPPPLNFIFKGMFKEFRVKGLGLMMLMMLMIITMMIL